MTVPSNAAVVNYSGNGVTTNFPYAFRIPTAADVSVYLTNLATGVVTTLLTSQYSISGINDPAGGAVTYPLSGSPLAAGNKITIERVVPYTQLSSIPNQGNFFAAVTELALDRITMMVQQVENLYKRTIRIPLVDNEISALQNATLRANSTLIFDANGVPGVGSISSTIVSSAMTPVVQAATIAAARAAMGVTDPSAAMIPVVTAATLALAREAFTSAFLATFLAATNGTGARSALELGGTVALTSDTNRKIRTANTMARIAFTQ